MPKRIQRKRTKGWRMPEGAVYVGRPTKWGNPFGRWYLRFHFNVGIAVQLYSDLAQGFWGGRLSGWECERKANHDAHEWRKRFSEHPLEVIRSELRGKDLACWCPLDQPCHADVLLELANGDDVQVAAHE